MEMEEDWTLGGGHTARYTGDAPQDYTLETYLILLTSDPPINFIKKSLLKIIS